MESSNIKRNFGIVCTMKKFLIVLMIIFICGVLSADVCLKQIKESNVFLSVDFYEQYANAKMTFKNVFWNILYERTKLFGILLVFSFTPIKEKLGILLLPLFSFIWGFYMMSCIIELGVAGIVVGLASVLPHGIFYGVGIGGLFIQRQDRVYYRKNEGIRYIAKYLFILLLFITACVIESLVGTHFIPWVIRLSLI